ncbi:hypothetical protein [Streptomyces sp. NPDC004284]|uniref:hypothetical protein n=1 Tax=Streptomyces sp. NPDC004284 TaxID=3364695 RepID=UPI0036A164AD
MSSTSQKDNGLRLPLIVAAVAVVPLFVGVSAHSTTVVNGVIEDYSYFSVTDIAVGVIAILYVVRQWSAARFNESLTSRMRLLLVLLVVVSVFQIVRGSGVVPMTVDCTAGYSFDLCAPAGD